MFLHQEIGLKITCAKPRLCKIGIPVNSIMKYMDLLENMNYTFSIYDYEKESKKLILKYEYSGYKKVKYNDEVDCEECEYYKDNGLANNINIFEILEQRKNNKNEK